MKCPRCAHEIPNHHRQCLVQYQKDIRLHKIREQRKIQVIQKKLTDPKYKAVKLSEFQSKKK